MKNIILLSLLFSTSTAFAIVGDIENTILPSENLYCEKSGGSIVQLTALFDTHSGYQKGVTKNFCQYTYGKAPNLSTDIVGLDTMSNSSTIAATYINKLSIDINKPLPSSPYSNPALNVCLLLHGTEITYSVLNGGFTDKKGLSDICIFGDGSSISAWSLIYAATNQRLKIKKHVRSEPLNIDIPAVQ